VVVGVGGVEVCLLLETPIHMAIQPYVCVGGGGEGRQQEGVAGVCSVDAPYFEAPGKDGVLGVRQQQVETAALIGTLLPNRAHTHCAFLTRLALTPQRNATSAA
jgi:hypothetical protein